MDLSYSPEHQAFRDEVRAFLEAHRHLAPPSGGPRDASWLYSAYTLRDDFAGTGLTLHTCTGQEIVLDEGPFHRGPAAVVRLIATRPA
jgi:hypothetical protein